MVLKKFMPNCCTRKNADLHISRRLYWIGTVTSTAVTTILLVICVCSDNWDIISYNVNLLKTDATLLSNSCANVTDLKSGGLLIRSSVVDEGGDCTKYVVGTVIAPEAGGMWKTCRHDLTDADWSLLARECLPLVPGECLYYLGDLTTFCCYHCQYTQQEFDDLDDSGESTYGTHYSIISFIIVSIILHCACYVLILIVMYKRIVPVVMMTGIIFILSASFLAFALGANAYKITVMNSKNWVLPHVSALMAKYRTVHEGWSMTIGWCAVMFSVLTSITWIRLSYHLATISNKIKPLVTSIQPAIVVDVEPASVNGDVRSPKATTADRVVQWAKRRSSNSRKSVPNGSTNLMEGHF